MLLILSFRGRPTALSVPASLPSHLPWLNRIDSQLVIPLKNTLAYPVHQRLSIDFR